MNVGEAVRLRIIELCKKNKITVNKLSTICGITQSTLNNIISGRNNSTTIPIPINAYDTFHTALFNFIFISGFEKSPFIMRIVK